MIPVGPPEPTAQEDHSHQRFEVRDLDRRPSGAPAHHPPPLKLPRNKALAGSAPAMARPIPGYIPTSPVWEAGDLLLYRATREQEGLPVLLKVPAASRPTAALLRRLEHEYERARDLDSYLGVFARPEHLLAISDPGGALRADSRRTTTTVLADARRATGEAQVLGGQLPRELRQPLLPRVRRNRPHRWS